MRCSVTGLSLTMFIFVTIGDSSYLLGVLLFSVDKAFILHTLPWIAGSISSIFFDVVVSLWILYLILAHLVLAMQGEHSLS